MNHFFMGGRCLYCRQPPAITNYLEFDSQTGDSQTVSIRDLVLGNPTFCPRYPFFLVRFSIVGASIPIWAFLGWELAVAYLIVLYFLAGQVRIKDPRQWFGLREVQDEYDRLIETLVEVKRLYYQQHIDRVVSPLLVARDKAFRIIPLLAEEPFQHLEIKLQRMEKDAEEALNRDLQMMFRSQAKDLRESLEKLRKMAAFLEKFEANKRSISGSLKLLRTKILLADTTGDDGEVQKILDDLQSLHAIYDRVDEDFRC